MTFNDVMTSFWLVSTTIIVWLMICNHLTYRDRKWIIEHVMSEAGRFWQFDRVSYNAHMWAKAAMRDAISLYPIELQLAIRKAKADERTTKTNRA